MSEYSKINTIHQTQIIDPTGRHTQEKNTRNKNIKKQAQENKMAELNQRQKNEEKYFTEIAANQYFAKEAQQGLLQKTRTEIPPQLLELYEGTFSDSQLATDSNAIKYLSEKEIEVFFKFMDIDGKKKLKFKELATSLLTAHDGEEELLIDDAARNICEGKKSYIYLMLCYLYDDLIKKNTKEKLKDRLKKIIESFERQESAYLFNFFSSKNLIEQSGQTNLNANLVDQMANISAGTVKLNSLRQTLQFISETLNDNDLQKMVSVFMKFQAKNLKKITTLNDGREVKEEISSILQQERNLIILNSIYNETKDLFKILKKVTSIDEKYCDFMQQIISVLETSIINLDGLHNMTKIIGMQNTTLEITRGFIKHFYSLLADLPQQIFYNEAMREKLLGSIRNTIENIEKHMEPQGSSLSFIRSKSTKINLT